MDNYQKLLLNKLENDLKNIVVECYSDEEFEDLINVEILDGNIEHILNNLNDIL